MPYRLCMGHTAWASKGHEVRSQETFQHEVGPLDFYWSIIWNFQHNILQKMYCGKNPAQWSSSKEGGGDEDVTRVVIFLGGARYHHTMHNAMYLSRLQCTSVWNTTIKYNNDIPRRSQISPYGAQCDVFKLVAVLTSSQAPRCASWKADNLTS